MQNHASRILFVAFGTIFLFFSPRVSAQSIAVHPSPGVYAGTVGKSPVEFTLTADGKVDRIAGEVRSSAGTSVLTGRFRASANLLTGKVLERGGRRRRVLGSFDAGINGFHLRLRRPHKESLRFSCRLQEPAMPTGFGQLSGTWLINDTIIMIANLSEREDGVIAGTGKLAIREFRFTGLHHPDGSVEIVLLNQAGAPDTRYLLTVCGSGDTMIGQTDESLLDNTSVWCRKPSGFTNDSSVCPEDPSCPYDPYAP